ncbi:MAG: HupE/UreJ family protein [Pseudomonadota bacterium]
MRAVLRFLTKLRVALVMSTLWAHAATAHEVVPTVADLTVEEGRVTLSMRITIEAFLVGIDLDGLQDTNEAEESDAYDDLRGQFPREIEAQIDPLIETWNALPLISADGQAVALSRGAFDIEGTQTVGAPRIWTLDLMGDLPIAAQTVTVNWPDGGGALVLRQQGVEDPFTGYLEEGGSSADIPLAGGGAAGGWETFFDYIPVGFDHILPKGLDHILFVLGLFLLSMRIGPLLWQVTAFTLAHTVTLALGALGWVTISASIVEPLIAASIVYVAVENIFARRLHAWRPAVVFGFGLLHGLGFASVLSEFGLPDAQFIPALVGFNIGVELGQLAVIAMAAIVLVFATRLASYADLPSEELVVTDYPVMFRAVSLSGSLMIAAIGAYWVVERVFF